MDSNKPGQYWNYNKEKLEEWKRKGNERLKREEALTKNAILLYRDEREPTPPAEEAVPPKEEEKECWDWDCTVDLKRTVDYRLAGMNSIERLVFKYFGPGDTPRPPVEPPLAPFPLTLASRNNYSRLTRMRTRQHNRNVQNLLKTRLEELANLKARLIEDAERYNCHLAERRADLALRKKKFVEELAQETGLPEDALQRRADEIYENYRKSVLEEKKLEKQKVQQQLEIYERLLSEYRRRQPKPPSKPKRKILTSTEPSVSSDESEDKHSEQEQVPIKEVPDKKKKKDKSKQKEAKPSTKKDKKEKKKTASKEKKDSKQKSKGSSKKSQKEPPRELEIPKKVSLENLLVPEIVEGIGKWEQLEKEKMDFYLSTLEQPDPPPETGFVSVPPAIVIKDYIPSGTYKCKLSLTNTTPQAVHCRFHKVKYYTDEFSLPFEVEPVDAQRVPPGLSLDLTVSFFPATETQETEARLEFITRRPSDDIRLFTVPVRTTPRAACPRAVPPALQFPTIDVWTQEIPKRILRLTNTGVVPCIATIRKQESDSLSSFGLNDKGPPLDEINAKKTEAVSPRPNSAGSGRKKAAKPKTPVSEMEKQRLLKEEEIQEITKLINEAFDEAFKNVFEAFRFDRMYSIDVPPNSEVRLPVHFVPEMVPYPGLTIAAYEVIFEGKFIAQPVQVLTVEGTIDPIPIEFIPPVLDLKKCLIGGDVQQASLYVKNNSNIPYPMAVKIPKPLVPHVHVDPPDPFIHPNSSINIVLRIMLRWTFCRDAAKYFDENTNILEFPVFFYAYNRRLNIAVRFEIPVFGIVTAVLGLSFSPDHIDLGSVTTMETSSATFYLINNTLTTHHYAFLDTPKYAMIMPNYGFGTILPGECRKLHLLYSPSSEQVGQPGEEREHIFELNCTTMSRIANHPELPSRACPKPRPPSCPHSNECSDIVSSFRSFLKAEMEDLDEDDAVSIDSVYYEEVMADALLYEKLSAICLPPLNKIFVDPGSSKRPKSAKSVTLEDPEVFSETSGNTVPAEILPESPGACKHSMPCSPNVFVRLECRAQVLDPLVELSAQRIVLPPTPCHSYSVVSLYLRCPSRGTHPGCYCGKIQGLEDNPDKQCSATFEFFSNRKQLDVQPRTGEIFMGEHVKIFLVFKPVLNKIEIMERAKEIKAFLIIEKMRAAWRAKEMKKALARESAKEKKAGSPTSKKKGNKNNESKADEKPVTATNEKVDIVVKEPEFHVNLNKLKINSKDIFVAKKSLLETMETHGFEARVRCLVETQLLKSNARRREVLQCHVLCPVVRPNIFVSTPNEEPIIKFGKTAIGSKKSISVNVHNISGTTIALKHSLLNPMGPFRCPVPLPLSQEPRMKIEDGIVLEPESWLDVPLIFAPEKTGVANEYFEIKSNNTIIDLHATGEGIVAKYKINPQFKVQYISSPEEKSYEFQVTVQNDCNAPLTIYIWKIFTRVGFEPEKPLEEPLDSPRSKKGEKKKESAKKKAEENKTKESASKTSGKGSKKKKGELLEELKPYLKVALATTFKDVEEEPEKPIYDHTASLSILPHKKFTLSIIFTPPFVEEIKKQDEAEKPLVEKATQSPTQSPKSKKGKKGKKGKGKKPPQPKKVYASKFIVTVGTIPAAEWIFWGTATKKVKKGKGKSKSRKQK